LAFELGWPEIAKLPGESRKSVNGWEIGANPDLRRKWGSLFGGLGLPHCGKLGWARVVSQRLVAQKQKEQPQSLRLRLAQERAKLRRMTAT
jgi:hypothetical protein